MNKQSFSANKQSFSANKQSFSANKQSFSANNMTERDEDNKVAAIKLIPVGTRGMDYVLVNAKGRRVEVGPIFSNRSIDSANNQPVDVENISEGVKWFRENGGV